MQSNLETSTTGDQGPEGSEENILPGNLDVPTVLYSLDVPTVLYRACEQEKGKIWHSHIH